MSPGAPVRVSELRLASGLRADVAEPTAATRPPLLLIHGLAAGAWNFERWLPYLAERGHPTHALDLRGRPGSRPTPDFGRVRLEDYVEDALEAARVLAAAMGGPPVVVGHSMGGLIAQKVAEAGAARALVLLCSMPPRGIRFGSARLALKQLRHLPAMLLGRPMQSTPEDIAEMTMNRMPAPDRLPLARRFQPESGVVSRQLSLGGLPVDAARVRCPVLVVSAAEDRFFQPRVERAIAERYGAERREYDGHAHFVVMEPGWERIAGDVSDWVASVT